MILLMLVVSENIVEKNKINFDFNLKDSENFM